MTQSEEEEDVNIEEVSLYFVFFSWLLALVIILSRILHGYPTLNSFLSEAALVLLVGMVAGFGAHVYISVSSSDEHDWEADADETEVEVYNVAASLLTFSPNVFFMALLPPILFNSGYQLRRELFYRHFSPIFMLATLGTLISALCTGLSLYGISLLGWMGGFDPNLLELLTFGSLIAATDTVSVLAVLQAKRVDPHLFYLVFGESSLNDAVALVLFRALSGLLVESANGVVGSLTNRSAMFLLDFFVEAIGSPALGIISGCVTALIFKKIDFRDHPSLELPLYVVLLMYVPFIVAECLHLSGIVTIFFSGISARRYVSPNVSEESAKNAEVIFKLAAYLADTIIFLELGLSVWGLSASFNLNFIACAFVASLLGRAIGIYPLVWIYNCSLREVAGSSVSSDDSSISSFEGNFPKTGNAKKIIELRTPLKRKDRKISPKMMHMLWFAGLRGAVAYACARDFPDVFGHNDEFIAATMAIVLMTIIVMGGATETLLRYLEIEMGVDENEYMEDWHKKRKLRGCIHRFEFFHIYRQVVREPDEREKPPKKPEVVPAEICQLKPVIEGKENDDSVELEAAFQYARASDAVDSASRVGQSC